MADTHPHTHHSATGGGIHKKLGPLEVWQWVAIGAAIGIVLYLRNRSSASASPTSSNIDPATGLTYAQEQADAAQGIDPTTGVPYAQEYGSGAGASGGLTGGDGTTSADGTTGYSTGSSPSLQQELSDLGNIEQLMSGLQGVGPSSPATTTGGAGGGKDSQLNRTLRSINRQLGELNKKRTTTRPGKHGHTETHHHNGKKTSSSTHHKAGQRSTHKTIASPSHQRHTSPTTRRQPMRHTPQRRGRRVGP